MKGEKMDIKFSIGDYVIFTNYTLEYLYYKVGRVDAIRRDHDTILYRIDFDDYKLHDQEYYIQEKDLKLFRKFSIGDRVKITDNNGILVDEIRNKIGTVTYFKVHTFGGYIYQIIYDICLNGEKESISLDGRYIDTAPMDINYYNQMCRRNGMKTICDCIKKVIFNGDRTIILWESGDKTIVKCADDEEFDYYSGFCAALAKKIFGSTTKAQRCMESKMVDQNNLYNSIAEEDDIFPTKFTNKLNSICKNTDYILNKKRELLDIQNLTNDLCNKYGAKAVSEALNRYVANRAEV